MAEELRYVIIKINKTIEPFYFIGKDRNVVYDSKNDPLDTKALSLKNNISDDEKKSNRISKTKNER